MTYGVEMKPLRKKCSVEKDKMEGAISKRTNNRMDPHGAND